MFQLAANFPSVDATFMHWAAVTDAYAQKVAAMERGIPEARDEAVRLARELCELHDIPLPAPFPEL